MSDVIVTRWIAASPPTVFAFFTDAERWTAWQGVGGKVDARAGGVLRVIMPDAAAASADISLEVVPPRRIVFTGVGRKRDSRSARILDCHHELEPADGGTMVRLTHTGLQPADIQGAASRRLGALSRPADLASDGRIRSRPLWRLVAHYVGFLLTQAQPCRNRRLESAYGRSGLERLQAETTASGCVASRGITDICRKPDPCDFGNFGMVLTGSYSTPRTKRQPRPIRTHDLGPAELEPGSALVRLAQYGPGFAASRRG